MIKSSEFLVGDSGRVFTFQSVNCLCNFDEESWVESGVVFVTEGFEATMGRMRGCVVGRGRERLFQLDRSNMINEREKVEVKAFERGVHVFRKQAMVP